MEKVPGFEAEKPARFRTIERVVIEVLPTGESVEQVTECKVNNTDAVLIKSRTIQTVKYVLQTNSHVKSLVPVTASIHNFSTLESPSESKTNSGVFWYNRGSKDTSF